MIPVSVAREMLPVEKENSWETQSGYAAFESDGKKGIANNMVTVLEPASPLPPGPPILKMKTKEVLTGAETIGCKSTMTITITLQATRIGWACYQTC